MNNRVLVYNLVVVLLMVGLTSAQEDQVGLDEIHVDPIGDAKNDITSFWMGESNESLYFLVTFEKLENSSFAGIKLTMRIENGSTYLVTGWVNNASYTLLVQEAKSFTDPIVNPDNSFNMQYIERHIFFNDYFNELGFFLDYDDIGGQGEVDIILWSISEGNTKDRSPDIGYLSFQGAEPIRMYDYDAALAGQFETRQNTKIDNFTETVSQSNNTLPVLLIILIAIIVPIIFFIKLQSKYTSAKPPNKVEQSSTLTSKKVSPSTTGSAGSVEMKYIEDLGREVRMCCYQTARLHETYCYCGRAVDGDIQELFDGS